MIASNPASRASWAGVLNMGPFAVPVKAYSALITSPAGELHQVHAKCGQRIEYRKTCPLHGQISSEEIAKAFAYTPTQTVELTEADLAQLDDPRDQVLRIERLVPLQSLDLCLLSGRTLYLVPSSALAEPDYSLAVQTLTFIDSWAIGRIVLSAKLQPVAIQAIDGILRLHVLHWPALQRACPARDLRPTQVSAKQIAALVRAIEPLQKDFSWSDYVDPSGQRLHALVRQKLSDRKRRSGKIAAAAPGTLNGRSRRKPRAAEPNPQTQKAA